MWPNSSDENNLFGPTTVDVNERTVLVRLNRALARTSSMVVRKHRAAGQGIAAGSSDYYCVDGHSGGIVNVHVDLETMAREVGALRCFETLAVEPHPQHDLLEGIRDLRKSRAREA